MHGRAGRVADQATYERIEAFGPAQHYERRKALTHTWLRAGNRNPSGNSAEFVARSAWLRDGRQVVVRLASRADAPAVQHFVRGLSVTSRRNRFFAPMHELSPDQLERITRSCPPNALAILAEAAQDGSAHIVAMAQYAACEPPAAEFAVVVDDRWQRQGLATKLLCALASHAAPAGLATLTGLVLADNWPMLEFLARHRCELTEDAYGHVIEAALPLHACEPCA